MLFRSLVSATFAKTKRILKDFQPDVIVGTGGYASFPALKMGAKLGIPTCCQEKEAAELFINFLCDPEISAQNMDYIGYSVPASESKKYMDEELVNDPVAYPSEEVLRNASSFDFLPEETSRTMESLFMTVRNG